MSISTSASWRGRKRNIFQGRRTARLMSDPECNICGNKTFADVKSRVNARCTNCNSLERTRLLWLFLQDIDITDTTRILHLAPERGLYDKLKAHAKPGNYVCADFEPQRYSFASEIIAIDLTDLDDQPSDQYDIIVHAHVMEHIPCNIAYTLFHLHRMMTSGGRHVCVIPFLSGKYDESFQDMPEKERVRRFGQHDHVRRFGVEDIHRHLGSVVKLPDEFSAMDRFGVERLRNANIPEAAWRGFSIHTVLDLRKDDFKLRN